MGHRRFSDSRSVVQRFGRTEAIVKGGNIARNVLSHSVIAMSLFGIDRDGILFITFLTFSLCTLFEVPAGVIADYFGRFRSIRLSYFFSFASSFFFLLAIFASGGPATSEWVLVWMACCAVTDSVSITLISGSYEAAYQKWYHDHTVRMEDKSSASPLFLAATGHAFSLRAIFPLLAGCFVGVLHLLMPESFRAESPKFFPLCILCGVLVIKIVQYLRIHADLGDYREDTDGSSCEKHSVWEIVSVCQSHLSETVTLAFADLSYTVSTAYLVGQSYLYLQRSSLSPGLTWVSGIVIAILIHISLMFLGRLVQPAMAKSSRLDAYRFPFFLIILGASVATSYVLYVDINPTFQMVFLVGYILLTGLVSRALANLIYSSFPKTLPQRHRATWISGSNLLAMGSYGIMSGVAVFSGVQGIGPFFMVFSCGLFAVVVLVLNLLPLSSRAQIRPTLTRILSLTLLSLVLIFCLIASVVSYASLHYQELASEVVLKKKP